MKNIIYYYYKIKINKINNRNNNYYFYYNNNLYYLLLCQNIDKINNIYNLYNSIYPNILHKIIINKNNDIITPINNIPYILVKINTNISSKINIKDIYYFEHLQYNIDNKLIRDKWNILWSKKIDYIENQINEIEKKYPLLTNSINYFIGMTENAISYYKNIIDTYPNNYNLSLSHDKITTNNLDFYNPFNIIIDHKSRDIAEYIKLSFYINNYNIYKELDIYFNNNYYTEYDIGILIARLLYPSYYFDLYDSIINNIIKENNILSITNRINEYEDYLKNTLIYLEKYYKLPNIDWIKK